MLAKNLTNSRATERLSVVLSPSVNSTPACVIGLYSDGGILHMLIRFWSPPEESMLSVGVNDTAINAICARVLRNSCCVCIIFFALARLRLSSFTLLLCDESKLLITSLAAMPYGAVRGLAITILDDVLCCWSLSN